MKHCLAMIACGLALGAATAQPASKPSAYEHLKPLEWMIGDWVGEFTLPNDAPPFKKGETIEYHSSFRWVLDRNYMVKDAWLVKDDRRVFASHEVTSWDPDQKKLVHRFYGPSGAGEGAWAEVGQKARLAWTLGKTKAVTILESVDANTHTLRLTGPQEADQKSTDSPKMTFKRKTGVPPGEVWTAYVKAITGRWKGTGELLADSPDGQLKQGDRLEYTLTAAPSPGGHLLAYEGEWRVPARSFAAQVRGWGYWDPDARQARLTLVSGNGLVEEFLLHRHQGGSFFSQYSARRPGGVTFRAPVRADFKDGSLLLRVQGGPVISTWEKVSP